MLSIDQIRKNSPDLEDISDEELLEIRDSLYALVEKVLDKVFE